VSFADCSTILLSCDNSVSNWFQLESPGPTTVCLTRDLLCSNLGRLHALAFVRHHHYSMISTCMSQTFVLVGPVMSSPPHLE